MCMLRVYIYITLRRCIGFETWEQIFGVFASYRSTKPIAYEWRFRPVCLTGFFSLDIKERMRVCIEENPSNGLLKNVRVGNVLPWYV